MKVKCGTWSGQPARYAHAKLDGNFTRVVKDDRRVRVFTSLPTDITDKVPSDLLVNLYRFVPDGVTLLGELYAPSEPASEVKSRLAGDGEGLFLTYFALERTPVRLDPHVPLHLAELEEVQALFLGWGLPFAPFTVLREGWTPAALLEGARDMGSEGWVLKDGNLHNWRKLKIERTIDCVVCGYEDGDGKYLGLLGSLRVGVYHESGLLVEVANVSGMTDEERVRMTEEVIPLLDSPDYSGTLVCEVTYQYVGSGGRLRHPRFVRWRDDKSPWDCKTSQDHALEEFHRCQRH